MNTNKEFETIFPFEYQGGGYFRRKGIPQGKPAEMLHGIEAVQYLFNAMIKHPLTDQSTSDTVSSSNEKDRGSHEG